MASTSTLVLGFANTWEACQVARREHRLSCCKNGPVADAGETQRTGSRRWWARTATTTPLGSSFSSLWQLGVTDHVQERLFPFLYTCVSTGKLLSLCLRRTTLSDGLARGHHPILLNGWDPKKLVDFMGLLMDLALSKWAP